MRRSGSWWLALGLGALGAACDFEAARQRYTDDFCNRVCVEAPGTADCDQCGADAGPTDAGPTDAGATDGGGPNDAGPADAGGVDAGAANGLRVSVDAGLVGGCLPVELQPVDAQGLPSAVPGGPVQVSLSCAPMRLFTLGATCDGSAGVPLSIGGPGPTWASVTLTDVGRSECDTSAAPPLQPAHFTVEARAQLRVELKDGGPTVEQTRCTPMQLRATDVYGASVAWEDAGAVVLDFGGTPATTDPGCNGLDGGFSLPLPSTPTPIDFYVKPGFGTGDGGVVAVHVVPATGVLAEESLTSFPVTCRPTGAACGGAPGACCFGCNATGTNTCY